MDSKVTIWKTVDYGRGGQMKHYIAEVFVTIPFESNRHDPSEDFIEKYQELQEFVERNHGYITISEDEEDYE